MGEFRRASQVSSSRLEFDVYFNFPPNVTWADEEKTSSDGNF